LLVSTTVLSEDASWHRNVYSASFGSQPLFSHTDGFYASWQVAFVVLGVIPFASITALMVMKLNQSKTTRQAEAYKSAGSIAYSSVSSIKTVLSLNAIEIMIEKYNEATQEAYNLATGILVKQGFWNGTSFNTT